MDSLSLSYTLVDHIEMGHNMLDKRYTMNIYGSGSSSLEPLQDRFMPQEHFLAEVTIFTYLNQKYFVIKKEIMIKCFI